MSIVFEKNGMARTASFGSSSSSSSQNIKKQAAQNLSSGRVNTFSFRDRSAGWVRGQNTIKGRYDYNYTAARERLNARTGYTAPAIDYSSIGMLDQNITVNNNTSFMKGQIIGGLVVGVLSGVFGLLNNNNSFAPGSVESQGAGAQLDAGLGAFSGVSMAGTVSSAAAQNAITGMESATNSATLSTSIASAQEQLEFLQAENKDGKLQQAADDAQKNMSTLQKTVADDKSVVTDLTNQISQGEQQIKGYEAEVKQLKGNIGLAEDAVSKSETNLKSAESDVSTYKSQLSSMDPSDPQKAVVEANLKAAEQRVSKYTQELADNKKKLQKANDDLGDKQQDLQRAEKNLEDTKQKVADAKEKLETAKEKLKQSEEKLAKAKEDIKKWQDNAKDIAGLEKSIAHHRSRMEQLKKSEQNELASLRKQIDKDDAQNNKLMGKIDDDGKYSKKELKNIAKIQQNNSENETRRVRVAELEQILYGSG